jgi:exodeoxyribonuclease V beta subunit
VLVRAGHEATAMQAALRERGVLAVLSAAGSVFDSPAAGWLLDWLLAEAAPDDAGRIRRVASGPLVGLGAAELLALREEVADDALRDRWLTLRASLRVAGDEAGSTAGPWRFAERWQRFVDTHGALPKLLGLDDGERLATDLRHLAELLHREDRRRHPGPEGLATWLERCIDEGDDGELGTDAARLRLESDGEAVKIVTVHSAKGLEYPVVFAPFLWTDEGRERKAATFSAPDEDGQPTMVLFDRGDPRRAVWNARRAAEARAEGMRLLYVAMTRAANHLVVHLAPGLQGVERAPLTTLLLGSGDNPLEHPVAAAGKASGRGSGDHDEVWRRLTERLRGLPGVSLERAEPAPATRLRQPEQADDDGAGGAGRPRARALTEPRLATGWWRASFTSIVGDQPATRGPSAAQEAEHGSRGAGDEPEDLTDDTLADDAPGTAAAPAPQADARWGADVPLADIPGGRAFGNWVHGALELLDFQTRCERGSDVELEALLVREATRHGTDPALAPRVAAQLGDVLDTPLDGDPRLGLPAGLTLAHIPSHDRRDELRFEVPLAGGTRWRVGDRRTSGWALIRALQARAAREGEAWAGSAWVAGLIERAQGGDRPPLPALSGMLTGFVDLVFRVGERWYVADYKGSRLSDPADRHRSPLARYGHHGLAEDMAGHGYHLQGLIYTVALHRLLAVRLGAAYRPERHLGGLLYLYLRGMPGAGPPRTAAGLAPGVFADRWPDETLAEVDQILRGEAT